MNRWNLLLAWITLAVLLAGPGSVRAQVWSLDQNDPNPFCPDDETTGIRFTVAETAPVVLQVLSPAEPETLITLVDGVMVAGQFKVFWDGKDEDGFDVPDGSYPYRMTAGDPVVFEETRILSIACGPVSAVGSSWGRVKALYR